jgi:hypothetical protein
MSGRTLFAGIAVAAVVLTVAVGLYLLGSPADERRRRFDERRVSDLQGLQLAANLYRTRHQRLPVSLDELSKESGTVISSRDPVTGQSYDYRVIDESAYELCAVFDGQSQEPGNAFWSHGTGKQCFQLTAREIRP